MVVNARSRLEVFVVRLWNEADGPPGTPPLWRGSVEHVETHEIRYFQSLDTLLEIIALRIGSAMESGS